MDIARLGSHPLPVGPEVENTAIKPPSPGTQRKTGSSESSEASVAHQSSSAHVSKGPLDDPALKAVLSEKLGGAGSGYSGPQIRMDRNDPEEADEGGGGSGPEAPSGDGWGVSKSEDPKSLNSNDGNVPKSGEDEDGSTRGVGFSLLGRLGFAGDGRATSGSTPSGSSSSTSGSSSSSGTTSTGSTTTVHPQHK